jgi:hypothetical protein
LSILYKDRYFQMTESASGPLCTLKPTWILLVTCDLLIARYLLLDISDLLSFISLGAFFFFFFVRLGLELAKQVLYHLSPTSSPLWVYIYCVSL